MGIVVVGEGAILESTQILGPHSALNVSPKSGERLQTFASEDKSFEFHLKVDRVATVAFAEKERTDGSSMCITRFLDTNGRGMCSLILSEGNDEEAAGWFRSL